MKNTHLPWAASIPDQWRVVPLKHVCSFHTGWTPPTGDAEAYSGDNLWANISDLGEPVVRETAKRLSDEAVKRHGMVLSPAGSLLFSFKLSVGQVSFAGVDMYTNEAIATFLPSSDLDLRFAYYAFPEMIVRNASENIYGAKMLNQQLINSAMLVLPPAPEQAAVAAFLDQETGRIDALAEEQRRLVELLREKRQAIISLSVTKGVDPSAKMKPSGVEWLGDVPQHWNPVTLGRVCSKVSDGPHFSPEYVEDGVMFLSARNIAVDAWHLEDAKFVSESDYVEFCRRIIPEVGDVLYTKGGTTGVARVVDLDFPFQVWVHVAVLKIRKEIANPEYVALALNGASCYAQSQLYTRGATNQDLGLTRMVKIWLALPPLKEQAEITAAVRRQTSDLDRLIQEAERSLSLLAERRSALISAAVTGKINFVDGSPREEVAA